MRSGAQRTSAVLVVFALALGVTAALFFLTRGGPRHTGGGGSGASAPEAAPVPLEPELRAAPAVRSEVAAEPREEAPPVGPTQAERPAWIVATPPGTLEVAVYFGASPAPGALVEVLEGEPEGFSSLEELGEAASPLDRTRLRQATTDEHGLVRWADLPEGRHGLRVTLADGARLLRSGEISERQPSTRVVVRFGSASVAGTLYGEDGVPRADALVWLLQTPRDFGNDCVRWTRTDAGGEFRFGALVAGTTWLVHRRPSGLEQPGHRARFELGENQQRRIDLGTPSGPVIWRGQLRFPSGAPAAESLSLALEEMEHGWVGEIASDAGGTFSVTLQPGLYRATLRAFAGPLDLDAVEVPEGGVYADLVLPPTCLTILLTRSPDLELPALALQFAREGADSAPPVVLTVHGTRAFVPGLRPGRYRLAVVGSSLGLSPDQLTLAPGEERAELTLQVSAAR